MKTLLAALFSVACLTQAQAAIIQFDLLGTAGLGLRSGNEPQPLPFPTSASGGEIGAGITYDDVLNQLTLNVGWGSSQGFTDLSSVANNSHIHGPTAANNGHNFTQTAGVLFTLTRSGNAVAGGTFLNAPLSLTEAQEAELMNGRWYINLHTANNGGGEIRGFFVPVPEPSTIALGVGLGAVLLGLRFRRQH